jgi:exopolyphosphatase / guanosine-5'-triphosphate,3'-diphosphate pyrophosphatase
MGHPGSLRPGYDNAARSHAAAMPPVGNPNGGYQGYDRPTFAALDLGTNNCRLLIARPAGSGFAIIDAYSRIVRLGEGLVSSGRISDAASDRAVEALRVCAEKLRRRRVLLSRAVATEACRRAANGDAFIARVREETGIALDIISAEEEARLAVLGCHQLLSPGDGPALVFDIGGGSTEIVLLDDSGDHPRILDWRSIGWGVVSLTEAVPHDSDDPAERMAAYAAMRARVREPIRDFADTIARHRRETGDEPPRLLGTSGTVTTLGSLYLNLPTYDRSQVDGLHVAAGDMLDLCARLAAMSLEQRQATPCIGRERADLVVAGCAILEEICAVWPATHIDVADRGIREGVLRLLIDAHAHGEAQQREQRQTRRARA